jgi:hypothetical protein
MPALVLFDQRTMFAGDDLRCCTKLHGIWRLFQLALACSTVVVHFLNLETYASLVESYRDCQESGELESYTWSGQILLFVYGSCTIILCLISLALSASMHSVSGRGTPTDPTLRRKLAPLCYFDMICVNFLRLSVLMIGCICIYVLEDYCECFSRNPAVDGLQEIRDECQFMATITTILFILVGTHIVDVIFALLTLVYFTCRYAPQIKISSSEQRCAILMRCCFGCTSLLTCCLFGGGRAVLGDFAEFSLIIANYLNSNGILDLTASDVSMGLDMVRRLRRQHTLEARGRLILETTSSNVELSEVRNDDGHGDVEAVQVPKPKALDEKESSLVSSADSAPHLGSLPKREALSARDSHEVYLMTEAAHFVVFAHAAYTWVSFVLEHPITGFCVLAYRILRQCVCCFRSSINKKIKGDHLWGSHTIALELISGLSLDDIVYATFYDTVDAIPYFIALDHDWKTIVLAIRGTLTLESVVADINCVPHELTQVGKEYGFDGEGFYCHRGMLRSAKWLYEDLSR